MQNSWPHLCNLICPLTLQTQVDEFDGIYNTQRGHQGLPGRITPQQAWDATEIAEPPRPAPEPVDPVIPTPTTVVDEAAVVPTQADVKGLTGLLETAARQPANGTTQSPAKITGSIHNPGATGHQQLRVYANGVVHFAGTLFSVTRVLANWVIITDWDPERIIFATTIGEIIAEFAWPRAGAKYQGISKARTASKTDPKSTSITDVQRQDCHRSLETSHYDQ